MTFESTDFPLESAKGVPAAPPEGFRGEPAAPALPGGRSSLFWRTAGVHFARKIAPEGRRWRGLMYHRLAATRRNFAPLRARSIPRRGVQSKEAGHVGTQPDHRRRRAMDDRSTLGRRAADVQRRGRGAAARLRPRSSTPWPAWAPSGSGSCCDARALRQRRSARSPATRPSSRCRPGSKAIYLSGWQVAGDANQAGEMYPDQSLYPANSVPKLVQRINSALQRADQIQHAEGGDGPVLVRPHRRRRRGRVRRQPQRLRADEGDDRGRRRRRPLRGPALLGQEVRPHGRQGAGAHLRVRAEADRRAPGRRRPRRAHHPDRPHRRQQRQADHQRRRPARPRVHRRRSTDRRGLLPPERRHRRGDRPRPRLRALRRPDLVRDLEARRRGGAALRRGDPRASSPASSWPTTARPPSTGSRSSTPPPSPASSASWAPWATSSSS